MVCTWPKLTLSVSRAGVRWIRPPTFGRQWSTECEQQYPLCVKGYLAIPEKEFFRCGRQSCPSRETIFRWFWKHLAALDGPNLPLKRTLVVNQVFGAEHVAPARRDAVQQVARRRRRGLYAATHRCQGRPLLQECECGTCAGWAKDFVLAGMRTGQVALLALRHYTPLQMLEVVAFFPAFSAAPSEPSIGTPPVRPLPYYKYHHLPSALAATCRIARTSGHASTPKPAKWTNDEGRQCCSWMGSGARFVRLPTFQSKRATRAAWPSYNLNACTRLVLSW